MKTICISGLCGSGKTTAVTTLAQHLPNSAAVHGDIFFRTALLRHKNEFEEIYGFRLDTAQPGRSLRRAANNASIESIRKYHEFFHILAPYIEQEIENAVFANQKQGKNFCLVEYVTLPMFRIWAQADYRVIVFQNKELRKSKVRERTIEKYGQNSEEHHTFREAAWGTLIDNAIDIDFSVENRYDDTFERDLIILCRNFL